jgi:CubicO group peptidase (beta-lactamase class C family)
MDVMVEGQVEPGFEAVKEAFVHNFARGRETGAAFCLHVGGRVMVDLRGGSIDAEGIRPYGPDALQLVFSSTKGATAACASAGGSYGFADPENNLAVGYVMNQMATGMVGDARARRLIKACYEAVGAVPKYF